MGPDRVRPTVRTEFIAQVSLSLANETSQREERPWSPACLECFAKFDRFHVLWDNKTNWTWTVPSSWSWSLGAISSTNPPIFVNHGPQLFALPNDMLNLGQHPQSIFATLAVQGTQIILLERKYPILLRVELQLSRSEVASPERTPPFAPDFPKKNMGSSLTDQQYSWNAMCIIDSLTSQILHWLSFTLWVNHSLFSIHSMSKLLSSVLTAWETSINSTYPSGPEFWCLQSSTADCSKPLAAKLLLSWSGHVSEPMTKPKTKQSHCNRQMIWNMPPLKSCMMLHHPIISF